MSHKRILKTDKLLIKQVQDQNSLKIFLGYKLKNPTSYMHWGQVQSEISRPGLMHMGPWARQLNEPLNIEKIKTLWCAEFELLTY